MSRRAPRPLVGKAVDLRGEILTLAEACRSVGISIRTAEYRISQLGLSRREAVIRPVESPRAKSNRSNRNHITGGNS